MRLGELIKAMELVPAGNDVVFDFNHHVPGEIDSYCGYYEQLAIAPAKGTPPKAKDFLASLKECVGKTFTGYRGGEYLMDEDTPTWVADYGNTSSTKISGVHISRWGDQAVLLTRWDDD